MMELFEREDALETLAGSRDAAFAGRGCVTLVSGPVAVGKSALLDVFIGETTRAGGLALTAIASRAASSLPVGVLDQFALGAPPEAEGISGAQTAARWCARLIERSARTPLAVVGDAVHH